MNAPRRLLGALALATALLAPAAAQAAPTGVNVSHLDDDGDPYVKVAGNVGAGDTAQTWSDLEQSGAKLVRSFVSWDTLTGGSRDLQISKYRGFADKANARGMRVLLTVTGAPLPQPSPAQYATVVADLASQLKGRNVAYEVWNEPDETTFWHNGPQPAEYAAMLKAAYPAIKNADPAATVLVGGLVGNDFEFLEKLYDNGAKGSFDGVGVHTDTACLTTDPREYYREPSGRIGRYSFTGYREVRATMVAHGDDKPVWMTELGWASTTALCERGGRAGTKAGGVTQAEQADFLAKAYGCLANDPWVEQAAWFNLHDLQTGSTNDSLNLGLVTDAFVRKPAFAAFQRAAAAAPIECGGTMDSGVPQLNIKAPTDGQLYLTSLPVNVTATDSEGVKDIDIFVDGKEVPLSTSKSGKDAFVKYEWGGAKNLAFGPHTIVATASDEAKNVGRATAKFVHVGGGAYPYKVPTTFDLKVGKVKAGKVTVKGKVASGNALISRLAHGRGYVFFSRFDTKAKRWKKVSRYSRDAKHAFTVRYRFKKRGVWRVTGSFKPKTGFKASRAKASKFKVR
jgi:cellulase (glycosyl hydrolase family 5)/Big-like domain-containing protein/putative glycosyl hydrolase